MQTIFSCQQQWKNNCTKTEKFIILIVKAHKTLLEKY